MTADTETLIEVEEIGDKIAQSIILHFREPKNKIIIERLKSAGIQFIINQKSETKKSDRLQGLTL